MLRPWLAHYPQGVPAEISTEPYTSLTDLLDQACQRHAGRIACTAMGSDIRFRQIDEWARAFAAWLQARGLDRGSRVALMMPNVPAYLVALLGTFRAGMVVVNVNPLYKADELERQLLDSGAETIVILENFAATLQAVGNRGALKHVVVVGPGDLLGGLKAPLVNFAARHIKKLVPAWHVDGAWPWLRVLQEGARGGFSAPALGMNDLAVLQYTGGTTGVPKGAMLSHGNLVANVLQVAAMARPVLGDLGGPQMTVISALPLYHVFALTVCGLFGMYAGMRNLLIINPRDQAALIGAWKRAPVNVFPGVNTLFNALAGNPAFAALDFSGLRLTLGGGMAVQPSVAERWLQITGHPLIEGYGLSETSPVATVNPTDSSAYSGSIGLPLPSTDVAILDDQGNEVPLGERGEVAIRGPQVMVGYWQKPEETRQVMTADGFFRTGDIGIMDERGYTRIVDRKKDMIAVSGFKVYPNEVEAVIAACPGVQECAVIGVPDGHSGEAVRAYVVRRDPSVSEADILKWCESRLTGYKRPRAVIFRDELPKSNVGKILRRELRDEVLAGRDEPARPGMPRAPSGRQLQVGRDHVVQGFAHGRIARHQPAGDRPGVLAVHIAADTAGFAHDQGARGDIPGRQAHFPVAVIAAASHPGQVQRRRAHAAHAAHAADGVVEHGHVFGSEGEISEGEAGGQHGVFQARRARAGNAPAIEPGADAVDAGEQLFAIGVVDHADHGRVFLQGRAGRGLGAGMRHQGDGDGVMRNAAKEVGGAVQGVDIPGRRALGRAAGFLGDNTEGRAAFAQDFQDGGLGFAVGLRDEVVAGLVIDDEVAAMMCVRLQDGRARVCRAHRDVNGGAEIEHRLGGESL